MTATEHVDVTIEQHARDEENGMTLDELGVFVQAAMRRDIPDIPGTAVVNVGIAWNQPIQRIGVRG